MKDFIKKKMYLILLVISFSTLFSAILYADPIYCEFDYQCPEGMICVIPGNFCMVPVIITCTQTPILNEIAYCHYPVYYYGEYPHFTIDCLPNEDPRSQCVITIF